MDKTQKIILIIIGFCMLVTVGFMAFKMLMPKPELTPNDISVSQRSQEEELPEVQKPVVKEKEYVNIYFIGKNGDEEVYKAVKRVYNKEVDGSKIRFALSSLMKGPSPAEHQKGVYTEIPQSAELISLSENAERVIINLNSSFVIGGGTESLYKRLYQIIKTANLNTKLPVYLYIDGQKADVVGSEGLMISQPLNDKSLEN